MIDLHCHLLPGVDDGSANLEISLRLAEEAVDNGVTHALLTPHHLNGMYINHKVDVMRLTTNFQNQLKQKKINLTVFPGQEVRINGNLLTALNHDDILFADEGGRYLMLEFPDDDVPTYTLPMIYQLNLRGITPIIVHPERNTKIIEHPDILLELLKRGCLSQVTAGSYVGVFGKKVEKFSERLIGHDQVYVFSSDAHALPGRNYEMKNAFKKLKKEYGAECVSQFKRNAKRIINGDNVTPNKFKKIKKHRFKLF